MVLVLQPNVMLKPPNLGSLNIVQQRIYILIKATSLM